MTDNEYTVIEVVDVLRGSAARDSITARTRSAGMNRNSVSKYIRLAEGKGVHKAIGCGPWDIAYALLLEISGIENNAGAL